MFCMPVLAPLVDFPLVIMVKKNTNLLDNVYMCFKFYERHTNCYYSLIKKHRSDPHNQWRAFMILLPCLKYPAARMKWGQKAVAAQSLTCQMQQRNYRQPGGIGQTLPSRRFPCPEIGPCGGAYLLHDWRHHCNLLQWRPALSPVAGHPVAKGCTAGDQSQAKYVIQPHRPVCQ